MRLLRYALLCLSLPLHAQNLPSLLHDRNVQSTFSIVAFDPQAEEWGIAVATNNLAVGASTAYIRPGVGAFTLIAETEPAYAANGFRLLEQGRSIEEALDFTRKKDTLSYQRQFAGVDADGNVFAFTGESLRYWKGTATHRTGFHFAVLGNQLAPGVTDRMAETFETTTGTLATRLLAALLAGERAGGQINGKQSAALLVKGVRHEWYEDIDLRVDHSRHPFEDLRRLLDYYEGRVLTNRAAFAARNDNPARARGFLAEATRKTKGWYGFYGRIAKVHWLLQEPVPARKLVLEALRAEPRWKENLPAFYGIYDATLERLYPEKKFTLADWTLAVDMLIDVRQAEKAFGLAERTLARFPESPQLWYLKALAAKETGRLSEARRAAARALALDPAHAEAGKLAGALSD
ncbi:DUF1028 domain-containing protein [Siphonobacter aquaeclarae]|uniref:Uncharacterized conserved protein, Ntn-hydrolase superfamily n=1 Tax=Siphonobacter aquaeclarae TaxID=563176 RepID=A0A1G9RB07_9BACT|nr:DUF1028 domain-containing protein [Siphonobacter aquaeclarae]SDM19585.1 Uncharacterized conserved protein, Ntn-hydrolase superfamily [Siphonobacter aquaeclarae]